MPLTTLTHSELAPSGISSILFLTCISAHRYSGVVYPLKSLGRLKKKNAIYVSVLVWLIVVVAISPILFYSGTGIRKNKTITCYDTTSDEYLRSYFIYSMCTTVAMFCIPLVLILGCYGLIVRALIYKDLDNSPLRRKSIYLVIIVLTVFAVSYIPFHVMKTMNLRARLDFQTPEIILFLTCISAHRYSGVVYPLKSLGRLKKKNAIYVSVLVWLIVVVAISPILFYSGTGIRKNKTITCYDTTSDEYLRSYFIYSMCTTVAMFCIPLVLILGCYGLIVRALIYKDLDNSPLRRKSIYLVIIVLTVFAVSYIPFHVMKTMNLRARLDFQTPEMCAFNDRVYATYQVHEEKLHLAFLSSGSFTHSVLPQKPTEEDTSSVFHF
ncbi:hypothetical protein A6R68_19761 [Neotoma lepida]|uniref:G-protein coupled receptors family 1 profile domain-containing protein n=1 Tax=Neotoma lepida TaxID=56216 RepID=A0A1A6HIR2_NEOLE|nr:hypothetical protein A6R68_19761 [Neotoma lepida]